jgi:hypothetical protein
MHRFGDGAAGMAIPVRADLEPGRSARMTDWNRAQPGPVALWHFIHANFPTTRNLGIYNHRVVAGTHTLSHHAEGRALDIGLLVRNPNEKVLGDNLFRIFVETASLLELDEIIWNHTISSAQQTAPHRYGGVDPHTNHIHVGFTRAGSQSTRMPAKFMVRIGILRTNLEELGQPVGGANNVLV